MSVSKVSMVLPCNSLQKVHEFYLKVVGCSELSRGEHSIKYNFFNHEVTLCYIDDQFSPQEHRGSVDKQDVPVPHFGIALTAPQFHQLSQRLTKSGIKFIIEPHLRFEGLVGEQWTMFFKDPCGNNLEFKAMANPQYLFAS